MRIKFLGVQFDLRRPLIKVRQSNYELTLYLPNPLREMQIDMPEGFREKIYEAGTDDLIIMKLLNKCGFTFSQRDLNSALDICVPGGVHLIEEVKSGKVVSMMMSRHLPSEEFPFGGQIGWLITDGEYRGLGLGKSAAKLAANLLIARGYKNIWVTTQIFRVNALNIFLDIGFLPTKKTLSNYNLDSITKSNREFMNEPK